MTTIEEQEARPAENDEEQLTYYEAAYAVASWKIGHVVQSITIDYDKHTWERVKNERRYDLESAGDAASKRYAVEQYAIVFHAGSVAEQLLQPSNTKTYAAGDHEQLHQAMRLVEHDRSICITWCNYLWQRTYTLLAWPSKWKLIVALARELRTYRTLDATSVELYLKRVDDLLKVDPFIPNAVLVGEVTYVCSPWHRAWHLKSVQTTPPAKRTDLPKSVEDMRQKPDFRPLLTTLSPLSTRAKRCLELVNIRSVIDLADWSRRSLRSIRGAGTLTVQEIVDAAERAGVSVAPDDAPYPGVVNPKRWRQQNK